MPSKHYTNQNNHVFTRNKPEYLLDSSEFAQSQSGTLWASKLKTLQKIKNIDFNFENHENITEMFHV
jgi:hypothetical protein